MATYHVTVQVHLTYQVDADSEENAEQLVKTSAEDVGYPSIRIGAKTLSPVDVQVDVARVESYTR